MALVLSATSPTTGPGWQADVEANLAWFAGEPWFPEAKAALDAEGGGTTDERMTEIFRKEFPLYYADWTHRAAEFESMRSAARLSAAPLKASAAPFDVTDRLGEIRVPTLILAGRKDFVCSVRWAEAIHAGIAGSRLVVLERSGHMLHVEEPEAYAGAIRELLEKSR